MIYDGLDFGQFRQCVLTFFLLGYFIFLQDGKSNHVKQPSPKKTSSLLYNFTGEHVPLNGSQDV